MYEADVESGCPLSDAPRRESHPALPQPAYGGREVVHPQADVVQGRLVYARAASRVDRHHEVHLHARGAVTDGGDVLVDVLALAAEVAVDLEAEEVDPQDA